MMPTSRLVALVIGLGIAAGALGADLEMALRQTIEGFVPANGTIPITVEVVNNGPDAVGSIQVQSRSFRTEYPVELPQGSRKLVYTYPTTDFSEIKFTLNTNRGRVVLNFLPESNWESGNLTLLLVTDSPGEMAFLRSRNQGQSNVMALQDAYVTPGRAPDRPIGYSGISAVIMGSGSERLEDHEVAALRLWTLGGGTLVFLGGASAPILNDPRWRDLLPASDFKTKNLRSSSVLEKLGGGVATPEFTISSGDPISVAHPTWDRGDLLSAERPYGVGRVVYMSFNPLEPPLSRWQGRSTAIKAVLKPAELESRRRYMSQFAQQEQYDPYSSYSYPGSGFPAGSTYGVADPSDPFSTKLPEPSSMFILLGIYFLAVVPLNFLVLKKLNRAELAWFTAPVLSLIFAGIVFSQAQSLYAAELSTASQGLLVAQEGEPKGLFVGSSQIFIPRGGNYDLKLTAVDSIGLREEEDYYGYYSHGGPESDTLELNPVDTGEIHVPNLKANNLAFREVTYRQVVDTPDWFQVRKADQGTVEVLNRSPFTLETGKIYVGKKYANLGKSLAPGERVTVKINGPLNDAFAEQSQSMVGILTMRTLALTGNLTGFRPGPQLGKEVAQKSSIKFTFFAKESAL